MKPNSFFFFLFCSKNLTTFLPQFPRVYFFFDTISLVLAREVSSLEREISRDEFHQGSAAF
jgi:hypothetical protein